MKIIIAGNGKVGLALTSLLAHEGHELVVIDSSPDALGKSLNTVDVMTVTGNCATMLTLKAAQVEKADLVIAATNADEINLLCCLTAKRLNHSLHTIARVRNPEYMEQIFRMREVFGLSLAINPERAAAHEIFGLLQLPGFLKREVFAKGRVEIVEIKINEGSMLENKSLGQLPKILGSGIKVLVCTVVRGDEVFIPNGSSVLKKGDHIYVTAPTHILSKLMKKLEIITKKVKHATIIGAGRVSYYLASGLVAAGVSVKVIEIDHSKCIQFAKMLPNATVICADGSSQEVLESEGIGQTDALVTLTGLDELNVIMSLYASRRNVPLVVTKVNRMESVGMLKNLDVGSIISPKELSSTQIVQYVRAMENHTGAAVSMHYIADGKAETLEFRVNDETLHIGESLKDIKLKDNVLLSCIAHGGKTEIPNGNSKFAKGDSVIVVTNREVPILTLNDIFQ